MNVLHCTLYNNLCVSVRRYRIRRGSKCVLHDHCQNQRIRQLKEEAFRAGENILKQRAPREPKSPKRVDTKNKLKYFKMIDPMAGVGDASGAIPGADATGGEGKDMFDAAAAAHNAKGIDRIRSFMGIVSGCVAGVLGLTGLEGLLCFIILHLTISFALLGKMKFDLRSYSRQSMIGFILSDLQKCGMSFMLFWTLFYGVVFLF